MAMLRSCFASCSSKAQTRLGRAPLTLQATQSSSSIAGFCSGPVSKRLGSVASYLVTLTPITRSHRDRAPSPIASTGRKTFKRTSRARATEPIARSPAIGPIWDSRSRSHVTAARIRRSENEGALPHE